MTNARLAANRLADLLARERVAMGEFLVALAEFDRRKAWVELGHSSLFYFLHRDLGLSAGAAHYRKTAAELVQKYPEIVEPLRDGRLCLTSIVQVAKVLTPENCRDVLPKFFQRSKREATFIAAELAPATAAPRRAVVTLQATAPLASIVGPALPVVFQPVETSHSLPPAAAPAEIRPRSTTPPTTPTRADSTQPLSGELARLHITVSKRFLQKLEAARTALSHSDPGAMTERVLETGLDLVLKRHASRKGVVQKPRGRISAGTSRAIPAAVKRKVWLRDVGRCQWPQESGGICGSTLRVEFDHSIAWARAGPTTAKNLRLLCRMHNDLAARQTFGDAWMNRFTQNRGNAGSEQTTIGLPSG